MARLKWGENRRTFDQGLDHGVLYLGGEAVPWNGLVAVEEKETGEVSGDYYFEGNRLHASQITGDYEARISAYTYPDVFAEYNGYSEREEYQRFGLSYRTEHGSAHRIHIVYNVLVRDDIRSWKTINNQAEASLFAWDVFASAVPIPGARPASRLIMEVPNNAIVFEAVEDILYGTDTTDPRLPDPAELVELYETNALLRITYNGDGTYSATGPDDLVRFTGNGQFELNAPTVHLIEDGVFMANSY